MCRGSMCRLCDVRSQLRPYALSGNDTLAFEHSVILIRDQRSDVVYRAGWPVNLYAVDLCGGAETEMQAQVVLREITAAAMDFAALRHPAGDHFDACIQRKAIALRAGQFEADPMMPWNSAVSQNHGAPIKIIDDNIQVSIIE